MAQETIIFEAHGWRVTSYGNGAAYLLEDVALGKSVFIQYGDDASAFRAEFDAADRIDVATVVRLFCAYSEVMS
jgi:hypothetical protein